MLFEADQNIRENEALKESTNCLLSKGNTPTKSGRTIYTTAGNTGCFPPHRKEPMPVLQPIQLSIPHRQTALMSGNT